MSFGANLLRRQKPKLISLLPDEHETSDIQSDNQCPQKAIISLVIPSRIDIGKTLLQPSKDYEQNFRKINKDIINRRYHLCNTVEIEDQSNQIQESNPIQLQEDSIIQQLVVERTVQRREDANRQNLQSQNLINLDSQYQHQQQQEQMKPQKRKRLRKLVNVSNKVKIQNKFKKTFQIQECSICLTDLSDKSQKKKGRLPCKHLFCLKCIIQSSKFSNRCPYCRSTYLQIYSNGKTLEVEQPRIAEEEYEDPDQQPCYICGRNDDFDHLLQCQFCQYAYCHTYCDVRLRGQTGLPEQQWYCNSCQQMLRNRNRQYNQVEVEHNGQE